MDTEDKPQVATITTDSDDQPVVKKRKLESDSDNQANNGEKTSLDKVHSKDDDCMIVEKDGETQKSIGNKNADSGELKTEKSEGLGEKDAGITEYLGSHPGFTAIIKQRYFEYS